MAKIYNSDCTKGLAQSAGIQQSIEKVPNELAEKIVPIFETNPELLRYNKLLVSTSRTTTTPASPGTSTYTCPANKDVYITGAYISLMSDAACDNVLTRMQVTIGGAAVYPIQISKLTTTAKSDNVYITFTRPIKIDRNSIIYFLNSYAAGNSSMSYGVYGYEVDNANV